MGKLHMFSMVFNGAKFEFDFQFANKQCSLFVNKQLREKKLIIVYGQVTYVFYGFRWC